MPLTRTLVKSAPLLVPTTRFSASAKVEVGHLVYISGEDEVDRASNASEKRAPAIGVVIRKLAKSVTIAMAGQVGVFKGLKPGATYYLGVDGGLVLASALPTAVGAVVQRVGVAANATTLLFMPGTEVVL
jgi:hypothetical protein